MAIQKMPKRWDECAKNDQERLWQLVIIVLVYLAQKLMNFEVRGVCSQ